MKIGIEARALSMSAGVRRYTYELIRHLLASATDELVVIYDQASVRGTFTEANEIVVPLRHELLVPLWLKKIPHLARQQQVNVMHYTKAAVPSPHYGSAVVTIYDIIPILFPASQKVPQRWYWPRTLQAAAERADHILTISHQSRTDIIKYLDVPPAKITATPLAIDQTHFYPRTIEQVAAVRRTYQLSEPYVLFVGTLEPRKNIPLLLRAYAKLLAHFPHHLVIVGKLGWRTSAIEKALQSFPEPNRLHWLRDVPTHDLPSLYSGAEVFVWPSVYEGWGFPPQEAMACGTPVIVSTGGSLPEVVGAAGRVIPFATDDVPLRLSDTDFEEKLTQTMSELLASPAEQAKLRAQGIKQAQKFSWTTVAQQTRQVYQRVSQ